MAEFSNTTVALFGAYDQANFGDDLMAAQIGHWLNSLGCTVKVFRLPTDLCQQYQLTRCLSVEELLQDVDCCIYGGGGMLTLNSTSETWAQELQADQFKLGSYIQDKKIPTFFASIGGDGNPVCCTRASSIFMLTRNSVRGATTRLKVDADTLTKLGLQVSHFDDIVLSAPQMLQIPQKAPLPLDTNRPFRIAINLNKSKYHYKALCVLRYYARFRNASLTNLTTHREDSPHSYEIRSPKLPNHCYKSPSATLEFLSENTDLVISSKLHIGVAALSLGKKFISLGGPPKAKAAIERFEQSRSCKSTYICDSIRQLLKHIEYFRKQVSPASHDTNSGDSLGHLRAIQAFLQEVRGQ
ncbi:MAG TPA: hypothetical protein DEA90_09280 [Opitutae bacterium]|nr:hypothetical protein [Puniceicoccaceae bacterium]HBR94341.1 hypothetical protein [Opitutae bacterium]|tara:strand:- start:735 stop:1799 length:1065 start_codon:yes stop_codon:yes gene_type:complete